MFAINERYQTLMEKKFNSYCSEPTNITKDKIIPLKRCNIKIMKRKGKLNPVEKVLSFRE